MKGPLPATRLRGTAHVLLYEINARVLLGELSRVAGRRIDLGTIPEHILDRWAEIGFDAIWMMGVWSTGQIGRDIARSEQVLLNEFRRALPDLQDDDIGSSPYAITDYVVPEEWGGEEGLATVRRQLAERGMGLVLDFVPNHTARDAGWIWKHPEFYVGGSESDLSARPLEFFVAETDAGRRVIAHGRDPIFPPWTDTAQLNILSPALRRKQIQTLRSIATRCDGVRCDMAMLLLNNVFLRTWSGAVGHGRTGTPAEEFWKEVIDAVREERPDFLFLAEAYWNREWDLQQQGFDFTYDKVLIDRLLREGASATRDHLRADPEFQRRSIRFLENHDEQRAARQFATEEWHCAAALIASTVPGMALFHEGQTEGWTFRLPVQLLRRTPERGSDGIRMFYARMLDCIRHPVFREGSWQLLELRAAWHDNPTWENFLSFLWHSETHGTRLIVVNYAPHSGQCYVNLPEEVLSANPMEFKDLLGPALYIRDKAGLISRGMYFDLPAYGCHLFDVKPARK